MAEVRPRRRFGQNFLTSEIMIHEIILGLHLQPEDHVLEIGPGCGALTMPMAALTLRQFDCVEIDRDLVQVLQQKLPGHVQVHCQDILAFDWASVVTNDADKIRVVGNLPYNISTPVLLSCLAHLHDIQDMNFMLQQEVVDRLCAQPGTSAYGRLSVRLQVCCRAVCWLQVPPTAFHPAPKVNSAMIRIQPLAVPFAVDLPALEQVLKMAFSARRKQLKNSLKGLFSAEALLDLGIDPQLRPDAITVAEYVRLAQQLCAGT